MKSAIRSIILLAIVLSLTIGGFNALAQASTSAPTVWEIAHFVDEFNDPTEDVYIRNVDSIEGTFSNSVTTNSELTVFCFVHKTDGKSYFTIRMAEYGNYLVTNPYSESRTYDIKVKTNDGTKIDFLGSMLSDSSDLYIYGRDYGTDAEGIIALLSGTGEVDFYIQESDDPLTEYRFTLECSNFADIYKQLH